MRDLTGAAWRKSMRSSASGDCVEIADNLPAGVAVRDSKDPSGPVLFFDRPQWAAFVGAVGDGNFDR